MKIARVTPRAIAEPGGLTYLVVRVDTDEGVSGYAETTAGPSPQVTVDQLKRELSPLVGASPFRAVQNDEALKRARASLAARAVANVACLDILGKATRASVYEILGGPTRHKVRAMAVLAEARGQAAGERSRGEAGGLSSLLRPPDDAVRNGARPPVLHRHPVHPGRLARRRGGRVRLRPRLRRPPFSGRGPLDRRPPGGVPPALDGRALRRAERHAQASLSKGSAMPTGYGRGFTDVARFQDLLREDAVDVLRPALATHGLTAVRKAAAIAETYYVAVAPFHRGGPSAPPPECTSARRCRTPSSRSGPSPRIPPTVSSAPRSAAGTRSPATGSFPLTGRPGLGLAVDERALDAHTVAR
jgi:galactonate dehydratase